MTRSSRSFRATGPKELKESKADKEKRLENYRVAKAQAKKFVIPGIVAILACVAFLFVGLYGFKGTTRMERQMRNLNRQNSIIPEGMNAEAFAAASAAVNGKQGGAEPNGERVRIPFKLDDYPELKLDPETLKKISENDELKEQWKQKILAAILKKQQFGVPDAEPQGEQPQGAAQEASENKEKLEEVEVTNEPAQQVIE
ncbi:hypothetical protein BGW38_000745 [Lunasporangiospora selenospora]|uniref:Uncharacterized protein n=1 Tax=Lunasporangiospora selenospora TaxID=979761 RepID=A0A9P6FV81_9FUNG|nr:hypothetical protein BGW38_000745 [Lunasporangiospora selenospora]